MSISMPTGDPKIDGLLVELTTLVKAHGKESIEVERFLEENQDEAWTDRYTGMTHYFSEIGEIIASLIEGITIEEDEEEEKIDPADWWKSTEEEAEHLSQWRPSDEDHSGLD